MKKTLSKEIKIGIAFIICLCILYFGINFLKGINIFKPTNSYIVMFEDVSGLTLSTPVLVNGYQVGLVYSMNLADNGKDIVTIINLNKGVKIPIGSKIKLDVAPLGGANVIIEQNPEEKNYISSTDTIIGIREKGIMDAVSKEMLPQISNLLPKIDSILTGIQILVNSPALSKSVANIEQITYNLETSTKQLNNTFSALNKDIPEITNNLNTVTSDVATVTTQFKTMDFKATYNSVDSTMQNLLRVTQQINGKDNSLGLLLNDRQLYDSINTTVSNAAILLQDIKENPSKYINVKVF